MQGKSSNTKFFNPQPNALGTLGNWLHIVYQRDIAPQLLGLRYIAKEVYGSPDCISAVNAKTANHQIDQGILTPYFGSSFARLMTQNIIKRESAETIIDRSYYQALKMISQGINRAGVSFHKIFIPQSGDGLLQPNSSIYIPYLGLENGIQQPISAIEPIMQTTRLYFMALADLASKELGNTIKFSADTIEKVYGVDNIFEEANVKRIPVVDN